MYPLPPAIDERIQQVRRALADALHDAVIGPEDDGTKERIINSPGERWFPPDSPVITVHTDAAMFIGGLRALVLQTLHPLAMAGVAEHSDYRNDPWGRLQRTAEFIAMTTFGPADEAERIVQHVRTVHGHVKGTAPDGREYSASDPHLLRWVHVAEVDSFLRAYQTYGAGRLTPDQADRYVADMAVIARKLGVIAPPLSVRGLRDQMLMYRHELASTPQSRDAVKYLLLTPPVHAQARVPYGLIAAAAVATLPAWARAELRIPYLPLVDSLVTRPVGGLVARTIRWASELNDVTPASS